LGYLKQVNITLAVNRVKSARRIFTPEANGTYNPLNALHEREESLLICDISLYSFEILMLNKIQTIQSDIGSPNLVSFLKSGFHYHMAQMAICSYD
jgi:hypothetical protein